MHGVVSRRPLYYARLREARPRVRWGQEEKISDGWSAVQSAWADHVAAVRGKVDSRKVEHKRDEAERRAENAEDDALFAIDFAHSAIEEAEYAVLDATLARMEADEESASSSAAA